MSIDFLGENEEGILGNLILSLSLLIRELLLIELSLWTRLIL